MHAALDGFLVHLAPSFAFEAPAEAADPELARRIVAVLATRIDEFRSGGHNVIWAAIPLKVLQHAPDLATPSTVDGIVKLIELLHEKLPARGDTDWNPAHPIPQFATPDELIAAAFSSIAVPKSHSASERVHLVTHADALAQLWELGHEELAIRGSEAMKFNCNRDRPDGEVGQTPQERLPATPLTAGYWSDARLHRGALGAGHCLKFPFSCYRRRGALKDATFRQQCDEQFMQVVASAWS